MTIGRKIAAGFGLALVILVAIGAVSYRSTARLIETSRSVTHTHQVLERLVALLSTLQDVETGERGYLIVGREEFLEPYRAGVASVDPTLAEIRRLTSDNVRQQRRLDALEPLIRSLLAWMKQLVYESARFESEEKKRSVVVHGRDIVWIMSDPRGPWVLP